MENRNKQEWKTAGENQDGTFSVFAQGVEVQRLTTEDFEKLKAIQGCSWLIFRDPGKSPYIIAGAKKLNFEDAL